ncbi:protein NBR1 [Tanacetum coccineum]
MGIIEIQRSLLCYKRYRLLAIYLVNVSEEKVYRLRLKCNNGLWNMRDASGMIGRIEARAPSFPPRPSLCVGDINSRLLWDSQFFIVNNKVKYGETLRRFTSSVDENKLALDIAMLRSKIHTLFPFDSKVEFTMTYVDKDGDSVTLTDDDDVECRHLLWRLRSILRR